MSVRRSALAGVLLSAVASTAAMAQASVVQCNPSGSIYRISSQKVEFWNSDRLEWDDLCAYRIYVGDQSSCAISSEEVRWTWTVQRVSGRAGWTSEWTINRLTGAFSYYTERTNGTGDSSTGRCAVTEDPSLDPRTPLF